MMEFAKRGEAFEGKFVHDEALRFRAIARRNRLIGLWAAQRLGKSSAEADAYATAVVIADFEEPGDEDVIRKVISDFESAGVRSDEREVRRVLEDLLVRAVDDIKAGR
jgi:hypothetical protein